MIDAAEALRAKEQVAKGEAAEATKKLEEQVTAARELATERRHCHPKETANSDEQNQKQ